MGVLFALAVVIPKAVSIAEADVIHGDADCDGDVDSVDALGVLRDVAGLAPPGDCADPDFDIDCSGDVQAVDALAILRYVAGLASLAAPGSAAEICPDVGDAITEYELVDAGYQTPAGMTVDFAVIPGSDEAIVLMQEGEIYRVSTNHEPVLFGDLSSRIVDNGQEEEGLLAALFHPDYPAAPYIFIYYNAPISPNPDYVWYDRISRFEVDLQSNMLDVSSEEIILQVEDPGIQHNGAGPIGFGPDGYLYASFGDGGFGGWDSGDSQDNSNLLGTVIRIDVLAPPDGEPYGIPDGNPFADEPGALDEVWAYGLRNPWRGGIDPVSGDLWIGEVGDGAYDEIDKIVPGGNYGWNVMEGPDCRLGIECTPPDDHVLPNLSIPTGFVPPCAVIGGHVYRGDAMPELDGFFIYSDFCDGRVWGLDTEDHVAAPVLLAEMDEPVLISSIDPLPDRELAVVPWEGDGVLKLQRK